MSLEIRDATVADLASMVSIYNALIDSTTGAWTEQLQTLAERRAWFDEQTRRGFPTLVAVEEGEVVGMTSFGDFRDRGRWEGYRYTVEHTIHVRGDRLRRGIGRRLMGALVARARASGVHVLVAAIDAENSDSLQFHREIGFVEVARMPETGFKFGRWLDLVLMQRILDPGAESRR